jgi:hypothetical protein
MIRSSILEPEFNTDFPYHTFPWRLEVNKDHHNVSNRHGKSLKSSKKHKTNVSKRSGASNNGGSGTVRKRKSSVDSIRNTVSDAKGTKCLKKSKTKN